jgi:sigma-B regulation protein RsbU (phosphoserine phosphatase)
LQLFATGSIFLFNKKEYPVNVTQKKEKILVVDDTPENLDVAKGILKEDYNLYMAVNGNLALKIAKAQKPDLILLDIMMPEIDGYEVLRRLKQDEETNSIPVIFLTAKTEIEDERKGLELGAVDYIMKPISPPILLARIRTQLRLKQINQELVDEIHERMRIQEMLQSDLNEAAEYVKALLPDPLQDEKLAIDWRFEPCSSLGGDIFGYHWLDNENLAIYLIDVSGHGVGAALLSASVINTLRSKTLPNTNFMQPSQVLSALNNAFPDEQNNYMFFTIWYAVFNQEDATLTYSSGGHPPAFLLNDGTKEPRNINSLQTNGVAIGALPEFQFQQDTVITETPSRLYIFSDGVFEIKTNDKYWELDEFKTFLQNLRNERGSILDQLHKHARALNVAPDLEDDYTIIEVTFKKA